MSTEYLEKLKIVSVSAEDFNQIEAAIKTADNKGLYLANFKQVKRNVTDEIQADLVIEMEYAGKMERNLNLKRYIIDIPENFEIIQLIVDNYSPDVTTKQVRYKVTMLCKAEGTEAIFKIIYSDMIDELFTIQKKKF